MQIKRLLAMSLLGLAPLWASPLAYPPAPTSNTVDHYGQVAVPDPYRPLENLDSPETRRWVQAETRLTESVLSHIPVRARLRQRLAAVWNYTREWPPDREAGRYFLFRQEGLQPQRALWVQDGPQAEPRLLLDPNPLSADHTTSIADISVSQDGKRLAWGVSEKGSDWETWRVRDVDTGKDTGDELHWLKFTRAAWSPDNAGFYYGRYERPSGDTTMTAVNQTQKIYYHKLGTPQESDTLVYEDPSHSKRIFDLATTDDGHYLIFTVDEGTDTRTGLMYLDLTQPGAQVTELLPPLKAAYSVIGNEGSLFYVITDEGAARGKVVTIDVQHPEPANWKTVIPEGQDALKSVTLVHGKLLAAYLHDAHSRLRQYSTDGHMEREVQLPGLGTVNDVNAHQQDKEAFFSFTSFTVPMGVYRIDLVGGGVAPFYTPKTPIDPTLYETKQVFYRSKDGTKVPLYLCARKGVMGKGAVRTLLYAYGGFDIPITPAYSTAAVAWMDQGGIYALANIRGGGEYGEDWHRQGMLTHKQTVFDDFIAAARYLEGHGYTTRHLLGINGRSNGGLLIGAVEVQRPDLFGACIPGVGVMDMLRFNKFTIGWAWTSEYGSPEDPKMFPVIRKYSPLHNIKKGVAYPPTLILTSDHDDRVVPAHSYKFAATMQADQAGPNPILIHITTSAGHGAGMPVDKQIDEVSDWLSFLMAYLK